MKLQRTNGIYFTLERGGTEDENNSQRRSEGCGFSGNVCRPVCRPREVRLFPVSMFIVPEMVDDGRVRVFVPQYFSSRAEQEDLTEQKARLPLAFRKAVRSKRERKKEKEIGERAGHRLRELASRGQRESGGGIHAT